MKTERENKMVSESQSVEFTQRIGFCDLLNNSDHGLLVEFVGNYIPSRNKS